MDRFFVFLVGILFLITSGCEQEKTVPKPEDLLSEETYISFITELQLLDALVYTSEDSTYTDSLEKELFKHYNITEKQFLESNAYYQSNVEEQISRIDSVLKTIEKEQEKLDQSKKDDYESDRR